MLIIHQLLFQTVSLGTSELIARSTMMPVENLNVYSRRVELSNSSEMQSSGCGKKLKES